MKNLKIIVTLLMIICVMISAVACNIGKKCEHVDENLDHSCDICAEAMGECADANKDHECDYGCDKAFGTHEAVDGSHSCAYCGVKLSECSPAADDGDCTTAIFCTVCEAVLTPANPAHEAGVDDGDCTTAVKCVNCDKNAVEATAHVAGADDGNCATAVKCVNCDQIAIAGGQHTPAEEGKCVCGYTCETICDVCGRCENPDCVLCENACYFANEAFVSPYVPSTTMENKATGAKTTMKTEVINGLTGVRYISTSKMNFRIVNNSGSNCPVLRNDVVYFRLVIKNNGKADVEFAYQPEYFGVRGEVKVKVAAGETVTVLLVQNALGDRDNSTHSIHDVIFTSGNDNGYDLTIAGQVAIPEKEITIVGATINGKNTVGGSGYGVDARLDADAEVVYDKEDNCGWLYNGILYETYEDLCETTLNYYVCDTVKAIYPDYIKLKGEGTESSPWLISSAEDFVNMAELIEDDMAFADDYYKMTCDIDFEGVEFNGISFTRAFGGSFDGDGYIIKNLYIDNGQNNNSGLFCNVSGGTIKNVGIESGMIEGGDYVGALIGNAKNATILNCFNEATVRGNNNVGGLVGNMTGSLMSNSFNRGLVRLSGRQIVGGLLGYASSSTVSNCYNIGKVSVGTASGQIAGKVENNMKFDNVWYNKDAAPKEQPLGSYNVFDGIIGATGAELISETFVAKLNANVNNDYMTWSYGKDKVARLSKFADASALSIFIASIDSVSIKDGKVETIVSDNGLYKTVVYGSDKKNVISLDGTVYQPLTEQKVLLILDVIDVATGEVVARVDRNIEVTIEGKYADSGVNEKPDVLPSLREWYGLEGSFKVTSSTRIVVDDAEMYEMSERIQTYIKNMFGLELEIVNGQGKAGDIVLKYNPDRIGELGDEGNAIEINNQIVIESATETGMLYGAISIMQIMKQSENGNTVPKGYVRDYPAYEMRGGMIEVCRKIFSLDYVEEIGMYMSWFKLNTLHLHINEAGGELGATFVVESKKYPQLNASVGQYVWSQDDYRQMQKDLKKFGVDVITEIDTPGHANVFESIDTNNAVNGFNFDLSGHYDEALDLIKGVFDEFLDGEDPVFQSAIVHMGTDESGNSSENMRRYISDLSQYLLAKDNVEKVAFWGNLTLYYGATEIDPENVITQIWDGVDYRVDEALEQGFEIINSTSNMLYCVPDNDIEFGYGNYFSGYADIATMYDTWKGGGDFDTHNLLNPSNFSKGNMYNSFDLLMGNPKILGALFCLWNNTGKVGNDYDVLNIITPWLVNVAERCWYGDSDNFASGDEFKALFNEVGRYAAYANPSYSVESDSDIVADYDFESMTDGVVNDSANGYNATVVNGSITSQNGSNALVLNGNTSLKLPFDGVGYPYSVEFDIYLNGTQSGDAILFECDECTFYLNYQSKGVTFRAGRWTFYFNAQIPTNQWVNVKITSQSPKCMFGSENTTILTINNVIYQPNINSSSHPVSSILGTRSMFEGINGYVDNLCIKNEYSAPFDGFTFEGKGTEAEPYLIQNAGDLQMFAKFLNTGVYLTSYFKLTADIDMSGVDYIPANIFKGTLDGNGYVISNLTISQASANYVGLIAQLEGGTIKNLGIVDSTIYGNKWVGTFAGRTMNAVIMNCFTNATVVGSNNDIGGFVGMFNSSKMYNCYSFANVRGAGSVGGLVGSANSSLNLKNLAEFDNVYSFATVSGSRNVGMIAGYDEGQSANTPVNMTNVYYCGDKNASGNFERTVTKLTEAQLTDGTLLNYLNGGVKEGYKTWEANNNGYPVLLSDKAARTLTIEGATIDGNSTISLFAGDTLDADSAVSYVKDGNLGWIYNGLWYESYEELAAAFTMPYKNATLKAVYAEDFNMLFVPNAKPERINGGSVLPTAEYVKDADGNIVATRFSAAAGDNATYFKILNNSNYSGGNANYINKVFASNKSCILLTLKNNSDKAITFTYEIEYFGVRGSATVTLAAGEEKTVFVTVAAVTGRSDSDSTFHQIKIESAADGYDVTIYGYRVV